jgi:hypothetical protein
MQSHKGVGLLNILMAETSSYMISATFCEMVWPALLLCALSAVWTFVVPVFLSCVGDLIKN